MIATIAESRGTRVSKAGDRESLYSLYNDNRLFSQFGSIRFLFWQQITHISRRF